MKRSRFSEEQIAYALRLTAARWPARSEPTNSQFDLPMAIGRIWFSTQLLSAGRSPSSLTYCGAIKRTVRAIPSSLRAQ